MPTLREYRNALSKKLGGFITGKVALDPDPTDALAMRSIITETLTDPERQADSFKGAYAWIGKYRDQRRIKSQGFTTMSYIVYEPPTSGTYSITFYGFGTTDLIAAKATNEAITAAIVELDIDYFSTVQVTGTTRKIIRLPQEPIDVQLSDGILYSQTGLARIEVTRGFAKPLTGGTTFDIHTKLPALDSDEFVGLDTHINTALRRLWFQDMFPVTPNANGIYDARDIPGFHHPDQIIALMGPANWRYAATLITPESGFFRLSFHFIDRVITTLPIPGGSSYSGEVPSAVETAFNDAGLENPYTIVEDAGICVLTRENTAYASERITTTAGTITHDRQLLTEPQRISSGYEFIYNAATPYLAAPLFQPGSSFYIYGLRPGDSWIATQTADEVPSDDFQNSTVGLVNDYDQAKPELDDVLALAYYNATTHLATLGPGAETAYWKEEAKKAAIIAAHLKMYDLPFDRMPKGRRLRYGGKVGYLWG